MQNNKDDEKVYLDFDEFMELVGADKAKHEDEEINITVPEVDTKKEESDVMKEDVPNAEETPILEETTIGIGSSENTKLYPVTEAPEEELGEDTDKFEDLSDFYKELGMDGNERIDFDKVELTDQAILKACTDSFHLDRSSSNKLLALIKEYRPLSKEEKNKFNVYRKLPDKMKAMINANNPSREGRNLIARTFLEEVIQNACVDVEFDKVKDLMGSIAKELDLSNTTKMYTQYQQGLFETNLLQHKENIKDKDPEKAELIDRIVSAFRNSYTFDNLIEAYKTNGGKYKAKNIELDKFETRILDQFNYKYINSKYDIPNIKQAYKMLDMKLNGDIHINDIKKFFILFYKYTLNFNPSVVEEHTFMYYTIMNIITLNFLDLYEKEDENEFLVKVKNGVMNVINTIKECDENSK